jgi:hypothetical protein
MVLKLGPIFLPRFHVTARVKEETLATIPPFMVNPVDTCQSWNQQLESGIVSPIRSPKPGAHQRDQSEMSSILKLKKAHACIVDARYIFIVNICIFSSE